nr:MAG: hypothetical protein [Narnaviridae sp.]
MANKSKKQMKKGNQFVQAIKNSSETVRVTMLKRQPVSLTTRSDGHLIVRNNEFLTDLTNSTTTSDRTLLIKCDPAEWPWIRNIADRYSKYRFNKLRFYFVPGVGTTRDGVVAMGYFNEATEGTAWSATTDLASLSRNYPFVSGPVFSDKISLDVPVRESIYPWYQSQQVGYVGPVGNLGEAGAIGVYLRFQTSTPVTSVGQIYVEYELELAVPTGFSAT